jgi:hypothetical protein
MNDIRALDGCREDADQPAFIRPDLERETVMRAMKKLAQAHNFRPGPEHGAPVRTKLVNAVRERIAAGEYESDEWLLRAVDLLLEAVAAEESGDCDE